MNIDINKTSSTELSILLSGEMDAESCVSIRPDLEQVAINEERDVILNLTNVTFLDSSGIGVIVFLFKRLKSQKRSLKIIGVQGQPQELMELLHIDKAISVCYHELSDSLKEA